MEKSIDFKNSSINFSGFEEFINYLHNELDNSEKLILLNLPTPFNFIVNVLPQHIKKRIRIESIRLIKFCSESNQWIQDENETLDLTSIKKLEECYEYLSHELTDEKDSTRLINKVFFTDSIVFDVLYYNNFGELYQPIIVINEEGFIVYANPLGRELMSLSHVKIKRKKTNINDAIEFSLKEFFFNSKKDLGFHDSSRYLETGYKVLNNDREGTIQLNVVPDRTYLGTGQRWVVYLQPVSIEISLQEKYKEQLEETSTASKLAYTDNLTGIPNLRSLNENLFKTIEDYTKLKRSFGLIMLDVDHFKKFNDTYGHKQGDLVLIYLAKCLSSILRNGDLLARYGGEEFTIIVKDLEDMHALVGFLERALDAVRSLVIPHIDDQQKQLKVTSSFGGLLVDCYEFNVKSVQEFADQLFKESDKLLYESKGKGRDCFSVGKYNLHGTTLTSLLQFLCLEKSDISIKDDLDTYQFFDENKTIEKTAYVNKCNDKIEQFYDLALNYFRGELNFPDKGELQNFSQYKEFAESLLKLCQDKGYPSVMQEKVQLILNELFTNAFFNSNRDHFENVAQGESVRKAKHTAILKLDKSITVKYKLDKKFIRLEINDQSGLLTKEVLNKHLFNNQVSEEKLTTNSDQGAGVGLSMVLQTSDILLFDVLEGEYTRILIQVDFIHRKDKETCRNKLCVKRLR